MGIVNKSGYNCREEGVKSSFSFVLIAKRFSGPRLTRRSIKNLSVNVRLHMHRIAIELHSVVLLVTLKNFCAINVKSEYIVNMQALQIVHKHRRRAKCGWC